MKNDNQMNPAASSEIIPVPSSSDLISQDLMHEIRQIGITGMKRSIDQVPAPENGIPLFVPSSLPLRKASFQISE